MWGGYDKVYLIDVRADFLDYIPQTLRSRSVALTQCVEKLPSEQQLKRCAERYELLRDTASLVITDRYHVAIPCCAMGIPIIMIETANPANNWTFDPRLCALNPHFPFYTKEQWGVIDWNPQPVDFEDIKQTMTALIISRIKSTAEIIKGSDSLSHFFAPSKERFWDTFVRTDIKSAVFLFVIILMSCSFLKFKEI